MTDLLPTKCFSPPCMSWVELPEGFMVNDQTMKQQKEECNNRGTELKHPHTHTQTHMCTLFQPSTAGRSINVAWRILWLMICLSIWTLFILFHTDTLPFLHLPHPPFAYPSGLPDTLLQSPRASCSTCWGVTSGLPEPVICLASGGLQSIHCILRRTHLAGIVNSCG